MFNGLYFYGQNNPKIDSISQLIRQTTVDGEKLKLYHELWSYLDIRSQSELAKLCADSVRILGNKLDDADAIYQSHYYYGILARYQSNPSEAVEHLSKYVNHFTVQGDSAKVGLGCYHLGFEHIRLGDFDKSLAFFYRSLAIHTDNKNAYQTARTLNGIGVVFFESRKYQDAIEVCNQAYAIFDSLKEVSEIPAVLLNLGNIHNRIQEFAKARHYYEQALQVNKIINDSSGVALNLANIAYLFDNMEQYDSAMYYHLKALAIREKLPSKQNLARSLVGVGYGYTQSQNYTLSKKYLMEALDLTRKIQSKTMTRDVYSILAHIYAEEKNYFQAFQYQELFTATHDSIINESTARQISELQIKYETEKKDQQIALLAIEKEIQEKEAQRQSTIKKASLGGLGLITLLGSLLVYTLFQRLRNQKIVASKNQEIKDANFKRQLSELEMKALQAQINPHFIFNCMNSINQMILEGDNGNASKYLTKFSKLIRLVLENAEDTEVSLKDELAMLEAYIQLEALRFEGEIQYQIRIKEDIDPENTYLPSMVLQPFVENAIWHGLMPKKDMGNGLITISIEQHQDQLVCLIEDNGIGREKALELQQKSVWKSKSLGLKITEERLKLLSKELQKKLIRFTDLKDAMGRALGTRVEVNIPTS